MWKPTSRSVLAFSLLAFYLLLVELLFVSTNSTVKERQRWVALSQEMEQNPLNPALLNESRAAVERISEVHDVQVVGCSGFSRGFRFADYKYAALISRQYELATAAYTIENGGHSDSVKATLYGIDSALAMYDSLRGIEPAAVSGTMDDLLQVRATGRMPELVKSKCGY